jgi:hypothetical protein
VKAVEIKSRCLFHTIKREPAESKINGVQNQSDLIKLKNVELPPRLCMNLKQFRLLILKLFNHLSTSWSKVVRLVNRACTVLDIVATSDKMRGTRQIQPSVVQRRAIRRHVLLHCLSSSYRCLHPIFGL